MVVSLNLPMIYAKSLKEDKEFYEVLDYYLNMIRHLHIRTIEYLGEMRASCNPLAYCMGGFYGGHLNFTDKIKPLLKPMTISYGITALNELQQLYNKKSIAEDGEFALETLKHINEKINEYKHEDGVLYAIYGTPAENLCFSASTMVQTYRGDVRIADIVPGDLVYSYNEEEKKVELKKVLASRMTNEHAIVCKVTFDNGQDVICTPNHPFAIRRLKVERSVDENGEVDINQYEYLEWVEAQNLTPGMRIKSNYITINDHGRYQCSIYHNGSRQMLHIINAEYFYGPIPDGYIVHHKDENKLNNMQENLQVMTDADHKRLHMKDTIGPYMHTSGDQMGEKNSFFGKHHSEESKLKNRLAHMKNKIIAIFENGERMIFECLQDVKQFGFTEHLVRLACKGHHDHIYRGIQWWYDNDIEVLQPNHKVVSVEFLSDPIPVYDIEVEDNHNFFVGGVNGLLVHNCSLQPKQFRKIYGIIENVSDREYFSNSFHCHVTEDITPIEKQDLEYRFWNYCNGGKIQYVRYNVNYNKDAIRSLVRRAMKMGYYEGVNLALSYCNKCGWQGIDADTCPECGTSDLTKIDRMNGYLAYSRVHGYSRLSDGKMAEIKERKSM